MTTSEKRYHLGRKKVHGRAKIRADINDNLQVWMLAFGYLFEEGCLVDQKVKIFRFNDVLHMKNKMSSLIFLHIFHVFLHSSYSFIFRHISSANSVALLATTSRNYSRKAPILSWRYNNLVTVMWGRHTTWCAAHYVEWRLHCRLWLGFTNSITHGICVLNYHRKLRCKLSWGSTR